MKETSSRVHEDRRFQIEAVICKIMKARKELSHNELIEELFKSLKFQVEITLVKSRIESLIEKDYIKRNNANSTIYEYVA